MIDRSDIFILSEVCRLFNVGDYIKSVSNDSKIDKAHNDVVNASMEGDSKQSIPNEVDSKQSMPKEVDSKPSIPNETQIGMV